MIGIWTQGQRAAAVFRLGGIVANSADNVVADFFFYNGRDDMKPPALKVDVGPSKSQSFGSAKAVKAGKENGDSNGLILRNRQQLGDFLNAVRLIGLIMYLRGLCCQIGRVVLYVLMLHCPLQRTADNGMMLDNRVRTEPFCNFETVVVLQIAGGYAAHGDTTGIEVGTVTQNFTLGI